MALRAKKPEHVEKRLKALFYGVAGSGKTTASIQFPKPYLIDTERGAENDQYIKLLEKSGGAIFQSSDFDDIVEEVKSLLSEKHDYKTLIIDPFTVIYNNLLDQAEEKVGSEFGRHYGLANKKVKQLLNLLLRLDMNVIITSHAKNEYGENLKVIGSTFDAYKKLDYLFDLVIEIQKRGTERVGVVKKTRLQNFEELGVFNFNYETFSDKYGKKILEKESVPVAFISKDQIEEIRYFIDLLKIEQETIGKILEKAKVSSFDELSSEDAGKLIAKFKSKLEKRGEK